MNTDPTSGLPSVRLAKVIEPADVAEAIVAALEHPRLWVHVPKGMRSRVTIMKILPRRVRESIVRAMGGEHALLRADRAERAAYEARVRSEPERVEA